MDERNNFQSSCPLNTQEQGKSLQVAAPSAPRRPLSSTALAMVSNMAYLPKTTGKQASLNFHRFVGFCARLHPFGLYLCYFLAVSCIGFLLLQFIPSRSQITYFNLFFTSVSAATASSMSAVEMEAFSDAQLLVMTVLMLVGGEVFTSLLDLWFSRNHHLGAGAAPGGDGSDADSSANRLELGLRPWPTNAAHPSVIWPPEVSTTTPSGAIESGIESEIADQADQSAARYLWLTVTGYFISIQLAGFVSMLGYLVAVPSAGDILRGKHIRLATFSVFTVVSTFSNCGFIPNNEGMVVFKNNSGLLLILCSLVVAGNTLFPPLLRLLLSVLRRLSRRQPAQCSAARLLAPNRKSYYPPLFSSRRCKWLVATVVGLAAVQMALFCGLEWSKEAGLGGVRGTYKKLIAALFMSLSSRHSGESVVDLSAVAPAILVLYVVAMYLPGHTSFLPTSEEERTQATTNKDRRRTRRKTNVWQDLHLSHISYLAVFTILICITERESMVADPLNFSVLNVAFEVVSAYGNVGFTTGYSCQRRLNPDPMCRTPSYGFVGAWTTHGKLLLIAVMLFGRLKRFTMGGGKAWKLI